MADACLRFDAIREDLPGPKWKARWDRSWPAYEGWFIARGGDSGPSRADCEAALSQHMPELVPVYRRLVDLAGGSDRAARFLSTWCPPNYLGGCSLVAMSNHDTVRLVRNYDLSPNLNEGLLLKSAWTGRGVMGMVEFLWGLSDGINDAGLSIALAYGGRQVTGTGFGITTILRYVLETCRTVEDALAVLRRVPSHMPYNVVLADASGTTASVEMLAGGGIQIVADPVATNHQHDGSQPDRGPFTRTYERAAHLKRIADSRRDPKGLAAEFLKEPLRQVRYEEGFGTLFTAEYDPLTRGLTLHWSDTEWRQSLDDFTERQTVITYGGSERSIQLNQGLEREIDWVAIGMRYASGNAPDWREFATPGYGFEPQQVCSGCH
ncbi:putative choloylglycine hydrolase [Hoeflea sp. IMCC20628]|uniref:C45 family autoproteolytic acyltransferase/hydolase n=1 Tax=Hoeflea sp. IMCC20628 TaxID=1620421 RepID=UPI00063AE596|nr:C45 family peptidase [Hoeflea sp. IMCC20628]AKI01412.1 putative choloylglycine hydrolase [Hoeflea sp. IMCC20628]